MYFHVYFFKLQIHAHIYRSFIRHHKMLGVRIAKRKTSLKSRAKANPCGTKLRARIFFGAGKFASQTYPAGELKSRGNPAKVSSANIPFLADNRKCCIFFVNAKQKSPPIWVVIFSRAPRRSPSCQPAPSSRDTSSKPPRFFRRRRRFGAFLAGEGFLTDRTHAGDLRQWRTQCGACGVQGRDGRRQAGCR